ncbi:MULTISPECIES: OB-fold nucleic acid binding domain-containing protein [Actinomycetes]|jgi:RecG-like helicase|nr:MULTISPECIES: OB-fold nucleic acid binding domain-containing protein [Actinomycetes]PZT99947.1 MAG: DNA-binding protein [Gordonia sp. (in: high G+C Gram-positive bacteria)]ETD32031.1 DNA-binding protein [Williamsia sp. D3]MCK0518581.1 OB-fold nucleic acid binding domain-containing protein [Williamsia sp. DF01-3]MDV7135641.1 OB-fold nucleic acid binding domain-containing protein [Williamsia muralis]PHV64762.1 DNA-binding protein [Williamsia marianensis]
MTAGGYLKRLTRRLTEDIDQLDAEDISQQSQQAGAQRACDCSAGDEVTMQGELRSVQTCSKAMKTGIVAEFFDGTDVVTLKFIGRNRIPGIEPGRTLTVRGRIGEHDGNKVMFNPYYELLGES